jgi:hypothetical protein
MNREVDLLMNIISHAKDRTGTFDITSARAVAARQRSFMDHVLYWGMIKQ